MRANAAHVVLASLLGLAFAACAGASGDPPGDALPGGDREVVDRIENVDGIVEEMKELGFALVPEGDEGTRYMPLNLDEAFQKDGLRVRFDGEVLEIKPGERLWGTPLRLTDISSREPERN